MALVLSSMREGVLLVELDGRVVFANLALGELLGGMPASLDSLLPLGLREVVRAATSEDTPRSVELETGAPSRWLRGDAIPVGGVAVLLVVRDVTDARRLEAVRRDFVSNASHELKTPAASIQAAAETIGTAALEDPAVVPRFAAQLEREAARLSRIVSDLLDLSRLETGSALEEPVALDAVAPGRGRTVRGHRRRGRRRARRCDARARPPVRGSTRELALMVRNLVDNAIRYTRPGGRVDVRLAPDGGEVVLTVADTGIGIPGRDLGRVFERFYRVDRARSRETGGTGLGLSIVRHVVENHGGHGQRAERARRGLHVRGPPARAAVNLRRTPKPRRLPVMTLLLLVRQRTRRSPARSSPAGHAGSTSRARARAGRGTRGTPRGDPGGGDLLEPARALPRDRGAPRSTRGARCTCGAPSWRWLRGVDRSLDPAARPDEAVALGAAHPVELPLPRRREPPRRAGQGGGRRPGDRRGRTPTARWWSLPTPTWSGSCSPTWPGSTSTCSALRGRARLGVGGRARRGPRRDPEGQRHRRSGLAGPVDRLDRSAAGRRLRKVAG